MRIFKIPKFVHSIYKEFTWEYPGESKTLYLTFDDGPTRELTQWILNTLDEFNAKASFFCVGNNVLKNPGLAQEILDRGHIMGNHTFDHVKNTEQSTAEYVANVERCAEVIDSRFFRPPYGRITPDQAKALTAKGYKIIMYTVLTNDFNPRLSPEFVFTKSVKQSNPGNIVVFHDNLKAKERLVYVLPRYLEFFSKLNYQFEVVF